MSTVSPNSVVAAFSKLISMEIDAHQPLDYEVIFDVAMDAVHPDVDDAVAEVEALAEALDAMLTSARALR